MQNRTAYKLFAICATPAVAAFLISPTVGIALLLACGLFVIVLKSLARDYDEERRLLYVAITRAESHVLFTAGEDPNTFLEELPVEVDHGNPNVPDFDVTPDEKQMLDISLPDRVGPAGYSPHSLMDDTVYEEVEGGEGMEFGTRVHDFAERYCLGEDVDPRNADEQQIQSLIDSLSGELRAEENAYLPLDTEQGRVTLSGVIDLLHITSDSVEIIDYKTDRGRHAEPEYRKQLSVYYHIVTPLPDGTFSLILGSVLLAGGVLLYWSKTGSDG